MELILNTNTIGYKHFLTTPIDIITIGLKNFCCEEVYCVKLSKLKKAISLIKEHGKKLYLNLTYFPQEKEILKFKKVINKLVALNIDKFIISDLGILNIFIELNSQDKVVLDLQTYVTNKYSAKSLLSLGIDSVILSKEITLNDIKEISNFNKGNIGLLCQGYYPITYSKRPILNSYYKNFKKKKNDDLHFIKEENREDLFFLTETKNNLKVYYNKQYSLFNYLQEISALNIKYLKIDSVFLEKNEIIQYINIYKEAINCIEKKQLNNYEHLKNDFNNTFTFETPFMHNQSTLTKEDR